MSVRRTAFFLHTPAGDRFALLTTSETAPKGALLYLHPFAEEMNKSRRMTSLAARAFAENGWAVLQIDLGGCGDSAGDFGDADWEGWLADIEHAWAWLTEQYGGILLGIWGLRAGSLLAADWLELTNQRPPLLLWHPVANGHLHLTQFLRLKAASSMLDESTARGIVSQLRRDLERGNSIEVAGYTISPRLAAGLAASSLRLPKAYPATVTILEVATGREAPSPANASLLERWQHNRGLASVQVVRGPSFWQTLEIETAPDLILNSIEALSRASA